MIFLGGGVFGWIFRLWLWAACQLTCKVFLSWEKLNRGVSKPGGFPLFSGRSRLCRGLFLVGAVRPRKRKRTNRENPRTIPEQIRKIPKKSGKDKKDKKGQKRTKKDKKGQKIGNGRNTVSRVQFQRRELTEPHWVLGQTRWVLRKTRWVRFATQIIGWEELTEFAPRNSVRAKKLTEFGVWNRTLRNRIRPVSEKRKDKSRSGNSPVWNPPV